jgi:biopolymer transport protein ExbB
MLPRDLSPIGMFLNADGLVQPLLIGLTFASVVTWTVWLAKSTELAIARRRLRRAMRVLATVRHLPEGVEQLSRSKSAVSAFLGTRLRASFYSRPVAVTGMESRSV